MAVTITLCGLLVAALALAAKPLLARAHNRGGASRGGNRAVARRLTGFLPGAVLGAAIAFASGPSENVWQARWETVWEFASDRLWFCVLGWSAIGRIVVGGPYGALERSVLAGTAVGFVTAAVARPDRAHSAPVVGAVCGLILGLVFETAPGRRLLPKEGKSRRWWALGGAVLALALTVVLLVPASRWRIVGWARGEPFYHGRPTSYWRESIIDFCEGGEASDVSVLSDEDPVVIPVLAELLKDPSPRVRLNAAASLRRSCIKCPEGAAVLRQFVDDRDGSVRGAAREVLKEMDRPSAEAAGRK